MMNKNQTIKIDLQTLLLIDFLDIRALKIYAS